MIFITLSAYNEGETIGSLLESLINFFSKYKKSYRVLLVNDGSSDNTRNIAESYLKKMPIKIIDHKKNKGLGEAFKTGLSEAVKLGKKDDIIITMDADNSHRPEAISLMVKLLTPQTDIVTASKYQKNSELVGVPPIRKYLSFFGGYLFRFLFPIQGIKEYTCAYRAYKYEVLKNAFDYYGDRFIDHKGFASTPDLLLKLRKFNIRGAEVPLILRYDFKLSTSKMNVKQNIIDTLGLILRRKFEDLRLRY